MPRHATSPCLRRRPRRLPRLLAGLVCLALGLLAAPATADIRVSVHEHDRTVVGLDDGDEVWKLRHPSQWKLADRPLADAVRFEGRTYYGVGPDLVEVDAARGTIERRWRFPARIDELAAGERGLEVTVVVPAADARVDVGLADEVSTTLSYTPGDPVPGRGFWSIASHEQMASDYEAGQLAAGPSGQDLSASEQFARLGDRWRRDRTNPLVALERAELALEMGDDEFADSLFETAAETPGIFWLDDLILWAELEDHGRPELASDVYDRARRRMQQRGVRPSRLNQMMVAMLVYAAFDDTLRQTHGDGDADELDRLLDPAARVFTRFEGATPAWTFLADWFADRGTAPQADRWRRRADQARSGLASHRLHHWAPAAGLHATLLYGLLLGLLVGGFALGLRSASRETDGDDTSGWLSTPTWSGLAGLAICAALCVPVSTMFQRSHAKIEASTFAPDGIINDGYGSPAVVDWLEDQPASSPRDAFLDYARSELEAARRGNQSDAEGPPQTRLVELFEATSRERFGWLTSTGPHTKPPGPVGPIASLGYASSATLGGLGTAALAYLLGALLGWGLPPAARWIRRTVPGAAAPHPLLVAPSLAAAGAALLALLVELDTAYVDVMVPGASSLLGFFQSNPTDHMTAGDPTRYWAWALLAVVAALHVAGLVRDARASSG